MGLINKDCFVCVDLEMTGLDHENERIIEIAAASFNFSGILETFETLIDPEVSISESSIAIHHITNDMVVGKPKIQDVLSELSKFIGKRILVGHGIGLDIEFLKAAAKRHNLENTFYQVQYIDTLRLARLYGESPSNSLETLRKHFNIPAEGAHRAMNDVIVNIEVFKYLAANFKTTSELLDRLTKPILLKAMPLGKHKGRPFSEIPAEYLSWASRADFDQDLLFSIRTELKKRKKGSLFGQAGNPFSEL